MFYLKVSDYLSVRMSKPNGHYDTFVADQLSGIDVNWGEAYIHGIGDMLLQTLKIREDYL